MLIKKITYNDYNGLERTEDFHFNLNEAELMEMQFTAEGLYSNQLTKMIDAKNLPLLFKTMKRIILTAYGEVSDDGKRFIKSEEISEGFAQTEAYTKILTELMNDEKACTEFIMGIMPSAMREAIAKQEKSAVADAKQKANVAALPSATAE